MFANYRKSSRNSAHWLVQSSGRPHGAYGGIFGGSRFPVAWRLQRHRSSLRVHNTERRLGRHTHSDFTDNRVLRGSPRDFYNVYKDTFDFLYQHESPSLLNLTVHAHFGGRPMMSAMLTQLLHYMKGFPEVWFARHDQIARWLLKESGVQIV